MDTISGYHVRKVEAFKIVDSNLEVSQPQCFAFLFTLKVVKETGSTKAKHLRIKYVWVGRVEPAFCIQFWHSEATIIL